MEIAEGGASAWTTAVDLTDSLSYHVPILFSGFTHLSEESYWQHIYSNKPIQRQELQTLLFEVRRPETEAKTDYRWILRVKIWVIW